MAIFHAHTKAHSRTNGFFAPHWAAHQAGLVVVDPHTKRKHKVDHVVVDTCFFAPKNAPSWAFDMAELWQKAENIEKRKDSTVMREFNIALPHEMSDDQRKELVADIAEKMIDRYQFAVQASTRAPTKNSLNYRVNILATTRRIGADGFAEKTRELDGYRKGSVEIMWIRKMISSVINFHLQKANINVRVDHRRLEEQLLDAVDAEEHHTVAQLQDKICTHAWMPNTRKGYAGHPHEQSKSAHDF